jgi:hypothetical protein
LLAAQLAQRAVRQETLAIATLLSLVSQIAVQVPTATDTLMEAHTQELQSAVQVLALTLLQVAQLHPPQVSRSRLAQVAWQALAAQQAAPATYGLSTKYERTHRRNR